jgi:predicted GNAT superfamily acetyltransferase
LPAWTGDRLVGASVAFFGRDDQSTFLHSHITGVAPDVQGATIGFALKQHQRAWALARSIGEIRWTFDPLIRRNAWFNLVKLAAVAVSYHPDFYGGQDSGRCVVRWRLETDEVAAASEGRWTDPGPLEGVHLLRAGPDGRVPEIATERRLRGAGPLLCQVPVDIMALRKTEPDVAAAWRRALEETMGTALANGYEAGALTKEGCYVLTRAQMATIG